MKKITVRMLAFLALVVVFGASSAFATSMELKITNGLSSVTVDDSATPGLAFYSGSVGQWTLTVDTGEGQPLLPNGTIDITFSATGAYSPAKNPGALSIELSQINQTGPATTAHVSWGGTSTNSGITYVAYYDNGNAYFAGTQVGAALSAVPGSFSGDQDNVISAGSQFSLTQLLTITPTGKHLSFNTTGDANLATNAPQPTPEPSSLLLLGACLGGLALGRRRFSQPKA